MLTWPAKDPDDILDYPLSWAKQMALDTDTIASYAPFIESGSILIDTAAGHASSFTADKTLVWLKGGTPGEVCIVVNRIVTAAGRQYDHSRKIKIKEL